MAGRIRTVKPEWLEHERLASCSDTARVLSIGLILLADDHGRGRGSLQYLASSIWCYDLGIRRDGLARLSAAVLELHAAEFVRFYRTGGQTYYELPGWGQHQRVDHPGKPRVPVPTPADYLENIRETLAPDHDHDHDQRSRPGEPEGGFRLLAAGPPARPAKSEMASTAIQARPRAKRAGFRPTPDELKATGRVLAYLREVTGRRYSATHPKTGEPTRHTERIVRLLRDGYTARDFWLVIWEWGNRWKDDPKFDSFLQPSTLFGPDKFDERLVVARQSDARARGKPDLDDPDPPENQPVLKWPGAGGAR